MSLRSAWYGSKPSDDNPFEGYRVNRLRRNGPRPGQSTAAWLYGKQTSSERAKDRIRAFRRRFNSTTQ